MLQMGFRPQLRMPPPSMTQQSVPMSFQSSQQHQQQQSQQMQQSGQIQQSQQQMMQQPQHHQYQQQQQMMSGMDVGFDGKMLRKTVARKTVDYNSSVMKYLEDRVWKRDFRDDRSLQADPLYSQLLTLPQDMIDNPVSCVMTKFIRAALNKDPRPVFCVCVSKSPKEFSYLKFLIIFFLIQWTPDGRRLITGASSGEFTLWNGLTFNFETILQVIYIRSFVFNQKF
jgi:polyadenylation factor subunit 2